MQVRKVLMTTLYFNSFSGSELHSVAVAKSFIQRGYSVTLACFHASYPLKKYSDELGIHLIDAFHESLPTSHYDIFFAQHYAVADYLVSSNPFTFDWLVISSLGPIEPHETLPRFAIEQADLISFVSHATRDVFLGMTSTILNDKSFIFNNYAEDHWFEAYDPSQTAKLDSIAIVSSHIPPEVMEMVSIARNNHLKVDCFGRGNRFTEITPEILSQYDLIITIGRTVQACLAMGLPVYCYDHFGGPGYITTSNFEINKQTNFSGRSVLRKAGGIELFREILEGYATAYSQRELLREWAFMNFRLETIFDQLMDQLMRKPPQTRSLFEFYSKLEKRGCLVVARELANRPLYPIGHAELFFETGSGFNQDESICFDVALSTEIHLDIALPDKTGSVRFDPDPFACLCKILSLTDEAGEALPFDVIKECVSTPEGDLFLVDDPQYAIKTGNAKLMQITFVVDRKPEMLKKAQINRISELARNKATLEESIRSMAEKNQAVLLADIEKAQALEKQLQEERHRHQTQTGELSARIQCLEQSLLEEQQSVKNLSEQLAAIYASRSWKFTSPLRHAMKIFKKNDNASNFSSEK